MSPERICSFACTTALLYSSLVMLDFFKEAPKWCVCNSTEPGDSLGLTIESDKKIYVNDFCKSLFVVQEKSRRQLLTHQYPVLWTRASPSGLFHLGKLSQQMNSDQVAPSELQKLSDSEKDFKKTLYLD